MCDFLFFYNPSVIFLRKCHLPIYGVNLYTKGGLKIAAFAVQGDRRKWRIIFNEPIGSAGGMPPRGAVQATGTDGGYDSSMLARGVANILMFSDSSKHHRSGKSCLKVELKFLRFFLFLDISINVVYNIRKSLLDKKQRKNNNGKVGSR